VSAFGRGFADAPLQIYCSALVFAPEKSLVRQTFVNQVRHVVDMLSTREADWDAYRSILNGHYKYAIEVVFSPDGQLVASSEDCTVRLWEAVTGTCRIILEGHSDDVMAVAFSPDGQLIASVSRDCTVRLWEVVTGKCRSTLKGHSGDVIAVAFSPDGQLVASASGDMTVRVWEVATGTYCSTLEGHADRVTALAFSPDGRILHTNVGDFPVSIPSTMMLLRGPQKQPFPILVDSEWILRNQQRYLWLPIEYQTLNVAVHEDIVCLGLRSGHVVLLRIR
jgi:predicted NACHT family NTPase